jgi:lipid intermediate transporter
MTIGSRLFHIPLTLLYSSLPKLFLLFLLSIWRPSSVRLPSSPISNPVETSTLFHGLLYYPSFSFPARYLDFVMQTFDNDRIDREWVVRNLLGGMAAGFGLRGLSTIYFLPSGI